MDNQFGIGSCPDCTILKRRQNLDVLLYKIAQDNNVIVATVNLAYLDFAINWVCSLQRVGLQNYFFHAADEKVLKTLEQLNLPVFYYKAEEERLFEERKLNGTLPSLIEGENGHLYGSVAYQGLMNTRTEFIYRILQKGYNVLVCDLDVVFLRNPFRFFNSSIDLQGGAHKEQKITGGFIYIRAGDRSLALWTKLLHQHRELFRRIQKATQPFNPHKETEQELLNALLLVSDENTITWDRIPKSVLADGKGFFVNKDIQKNGIWPMAIHDNYIVGRENKRQRFVNASLWYVRDDMTCVTFPSYLPPPPKEHKVKYIFKLFAQDRPDSLTRLLQSLTTAKYGREPIRLEIFVDLASTPQENPAAERLRQGVIEVAANYRWDHGEKQVILREKHVGLAGQWLNSWFPQSDSEICLFLEDDNIVSPEFFTFIQEIAQRFYLDPDNYDPRIYGFALQNQHMIPGRYPQTPHELLPEQVHFYRYQQMSTWGPVFFPNHWAEFLTWYATRSQDHRFVPLFSNVITNTWFLKRGGGRSVWSAWFMRFTAEKGWYSIYTNFPDRAALVVNHREKGINFKETKGPNSPLMTSLEGIEFPPTVESMPLYDFHFNRIEEDPAILETRGLYSDTYNVVLH